MLWQLLACNPQLAPAGLALAQTPHGSAPPHPLGWLTAQPSPLQKTRLVVSRGKLCRKLNRIWHPKRLRVPVPVRSSRLCPVAITSRTRSRYCTPTTDCGET